MSFNELYGAIADVIPGIVRHPAPSILLDYVAANSARDASAACCHLPSAVRWSKSKRLKRKKIQMGGHL